MKDTITIITPVYNMGKYLDQCIPSIQLQTDPDFLLLLIDDGSNDSSAEICDDYAFSDSRLLVVHTHNRKQGAARNLALDFASTDTIAMIDSDDSVNCRYLEYLRKAMEETKADLVLSDFFPYREDSEVILNQEIPYTKESIRLFSRDEMMEEICCRYLGKLVMPQKLYRKKALQGIRYPVIGVNIDEWTIHHILLNCETIVHTNLPLYYYRLSPEGMTRNFSRVKYSGVKALIDRLHTAETEGYDNCVPDLCFQLYAKTILYFDTCKEKGIDASEDYKDVKKYLREAYEKGIKTRRNTFDRKHRVVCRSLFIDYRIFDFLRRVLLKNSSVFF